MSWAPDRQARLVQAVQTNCDIADARHAADMTLCTYLLQMREFHRWERGLPLGAALDRQAVGAWIAAREALWESLAQRDFVGLPLGPGDGAIDPFDAAAVNARLQPLGWVYGAGLVAQRRPVFFIAELHRAGQREGLDVLQAGTEYARCLLAPPAALAGGGLGPIVLRRQSLARWCWERVEAFALRPRPGNALHEMVQAYGLDRDFHAALPAWLDDQVETAILHELGEFQAGQWLGLAWTALRAALPGGASEARARALRDHLADLSITLPRLLARADPAPLHAWFAGYDGQREALFPALATAYAAWRESGDARPLQAAIDAGRRHFESLARTLLATWQQEGEKAADRIAARLGAASAVCCGMSAE